MDDPEKKDSVGKSLILALLSPCLCLVLLIATGGFGMCGPTNWWGMLFPSLLLIALELWSIKLLMPKTDYRSPMSWAGTVFSVLVSIPMIILGGFITYGGIDMWSYTRHFAR